MACSKYSSKYTVGDSDTHNPHTNNLKYNCSDIELSNYKNDTAHFTDDCTNSFYIKSITKQMGNCVLTNSNTKCANGPAEHIVDTDYEQCKKNKKYVSPMELTQPYSKTNCSSTVIDTKQLSTATEIKAACEANTNCEYATFEYSDGKISGDVNFYDNNCIVDYLKQTNSYTEPNKFTYSKGENRLTSNKWICDNLKQLIGSNTFDSKDFYTNKKLLFFIKKVDIERLNYIIKNYKHPDYNLTEEQKNIIQHSLHDSNRFTTNTNKDYNNLYNEQKRPPITKQFTKISVQHKQYIFVLDINFKIYKVEKPFKEHTFQVMGNKDFQKIYTTKNDLWAIDTAGKLWYKNSFNDNTFVRYTITHSSDADINISDFAINDRDADNVWVVGNDKTKDNIYFCQKKDNKISPNSSWNKLSNTIFTNIYMDNDRLWGLKSNSEIHLYDEVKNNFTTLKDSSNLIHINLGIGSDFIFAINNKNELQILKKSDITTSNFAAAKGAVIMNNYFDVQANNDIIYGIDSNHNIVEILTNETYQIIANNNKSQILQTFNTLNEMYRVFTKPNGMADLGSWRIQHRVALSSKAKEIYEQARKIVNKLHTHVETYGASKGWSSEVIATHCLHGVHNMIHNYLERLVHGNIDKLHEDPEGNGGYFLQDRSKGTKFWWGPDPLKMLQNTIDDGINMYFMISSNSGKLIINSTEPGILNPTNKTYDEVKVFCILSAFKGVSKVLGPRGAFHIHEKFHEKTDNSGSIVGRQSSEHFTSKTQIPVHLLKNIYNVFSTGHNLDGNPVDSNNLLKIISYYGKRLNGKYIYNRDIELALS